MQAPILAKIANRLYAVRSRVLACLHSIRAEGLAATSHNQEVFSFSISKDPRYEISNQFKFHSICLQTRIIQISFFALQSIKFGPDFESQMWRLHWFCI